MKRAFLSAPNVAVVIAGSTLIWSMVVAASLTWPSGWVGDNVGLSSVREARAMAHLATPAPSAAARFASRRETELSLRENVANPTAWLRLAYIDSLEPEGLSEQGIALLDRSYDVAPLGPDNTHWRLVFAFNHWDRLETPLRTRVASEVAALAQTDHPWELNAIAREVQNPQGRFAALLFAAQADNFARARAANARGRQP